MKLIKYIFVAMALAFLCSCAARPVITTDKEKPGDRLFERAERSFDSGEYEQARKDYANYLEQFPDQSLAPAALLKIGAIYSARGEYSRARSSYEIMVKQYPNSPYAPDGMVEILVTYYNEGLYKEVIRHSYEVPENLVPGDYVVRKYAIIGDAFLALGYPMDAVDSFITAYIKAESSENQGISAKLLKALRKVSHEDIEGLLARTKDDVLKGFILYQQGVNYADEGNNERALKVLTTYIQDFPDHETIMAAQVLKEKLLNSVFDINLIGCLLPTSGKYEGYGNKAQMGFDLAYNNFSVREDNSEVRVIYRDTESDPEKARAAVKEFAELGVAAIVGPVGTVEAAAEEAQLRGVPIITLTGKADITATGDYVFRNFLTRKMQVKSIVSYAFEVLGLNNFAIMYPDEQYGKDLMNLFWDEVAAYGGEIVGVESYASSNTDFAKSIKRLVGMYYPIPESLDVLSEGDVEERVDEELQYGRRTRPVIDFDAVFIPDSSEKVGLILPQLSFYDVGDVYLLGTNLWHSDTLIEMAGKNARATVIPDGFFAGSKDDIVVDFVNGFTDAFGETPGFIEAISYDSAMVLFEVIKNGDVASHGQFRNRLLQLSNLKGVTGITSFDETGDAWKELYLLRATGKGFVELPK